MHLEKSTNGILKKKCLTKCVGELKLRQGRAKFHRMNDKKDKETGSLLTTLWMPHLTFSNALACQWKTGKTKPQSS